MVLVEVVKTCLRLSQESAGVFCEFNFNEVALTAALAANVPSYGGRIWGSEVSLSVPYSKHHDIFVQISE